MSNPLGLLIYNLMVAHSHNGFVYILSLFHVSPYNQQFHRGYIYSNCFKAFFIAILL